MEAASSVASPSSSDSSAASSSDFSSLPVMALREKIVGKIFENRVTLIIGETGCGKSSQVPQFLLEANMSPILCTQPRRFAVVAVASMVAKSRKCELGGEVGYHIGHSKHLSERSKIVFKTAGVLLDEMRDRGVNALKYKVIILDEVHERSVESDLVLVFVKQFLMKNFNLRVVLMSATANISRYRDYFWDLDRDERVEVLAIPSTDQKTIFQRNVFYLEQVNEILGMDSKMSLSTYCPSPSPFVADAAIKPEVHKLIHDLILHIHKKEPDIEKSILVFLPTYLALEQQWHRLKPFWGTFKVYILHRSIDTEQALMAMRICKSHRKVILATNVAESSVTIPKVAFVIDSCRSLQVFWDLTRKRDSVELVWVSKSQADQRKGRTGRTCDGEVYRLVPRSFYGRLEDHEAPVILRLSLRQQVLHICCAESRAINDPKALLRKTLDPPEPEVVDDALNLLVNMQALHKTSPRSRHEPTFYGHLLASFSLSFEASVLVIKFGQMHMLREGILLGILMDTQPLPILHPFGDEILFAEYIRRYFGGDSGKDVLASRKEIELLANLCAFQFWQRVFKDKERLEHLKQLLNLDQVNAVKPMLPKIEEDWCSFHCLVQPALQHVAEMYEDVINSLHRFRPDFFGKCNALPAYYDPYDFGHTCCLECQPCEETSSLPYDEEPSELVREKRKCISVPYVASHQFKMTFVSEKMATIIKEIRFLHSQNRSDSLQSTTGCVGSNSVVEPPLCIYFKNGLCDRGSRCPFSHSLQARRPMCKFFMSLQGCRNGESCNFSHDILPPSSSYPSTPCLPEDTRAHAESLLSFFPASPDGCILVLDDTDMHFTFNVARYYGPKKIISTSSLSETAGCNLLLTDVKTLWGLNHPYQTIISKAGENPISWNEVKCVLWFLNPDIYSENAEILRNLVQNFFEYLAIRLLGDQLYDVRVILTMNNIKFSQLQVEKLARNCFFFLTESFPYDETTFGELSGNVTINRPMVVSIPVSYVFDLHTPSDLLSGDYVQVLHQALHDGYKRDRGWTF